MVVMAVVAPSCGGEPQHRDDVPETRACGGARWQVVLEGQRRAPRPGLTIHKDHLYFPTAAGGLQRVPVAGGTPEVLLENGVGSFWSDGSLMFFADSERGDRLLVFPLAGGPPMAALDGNTTTPLSDVGPTRSRSAVQEFDGKTFYWLLESDAEQSVWSMPLRGGGAARKLSVLPRPAAPTVLHTVTALILADSELMVPTAEGEVFVIPAEGGEARPVKAYGQFLASDGLVVVWGDKVVGMNGERRVVTSAPRKERNGAIPFWPRRPPTYTIGAVWPGGNSGWIIGGWQTFDDGAKHVSMWALDNTDAATWIGCDPQAIAGGAAFDGLAFTRDAAYLAVAQLATETWSLVKLRLPVAP